MDSDKWFAISLCVFIVTVGACVMFHMSRRSPSTCEAGVFDADGIASIKCEGARVTIEERAGKRYAVCSCELDVSTADAGLDTAVER